MKLLTTNQRKELIERVALRYHPDGIERLNETGSIQQYLPLYHYTIFSPNGGSNLFVTELFSNPKYQLSPPGSHTGQRLQYHGDYQGLNSVVCQFMIGSMIAPENLFYHEKTIHGKELKLSRRQRKNIGEQITESITHRVVCPMGMRPSFVVLGSGKNLDRKLRENFDKSLIYLYEMIGSTPNPLILRDIGGEQISGTYHVS
ncbi:MAG: hypothetical protein WCI72_04485 [archaeon]